MFLVVLVACLKMFLEVFGGLDWMIELQKL